MDQTRETMVAFAADLDYGGLTPAAVHAVKRSILDSIGCAYGAFRAEPMIAARRLAARMSAIEPATIIGTRIRSSPEMAAVTNGAMIRYLDFSDDYFGGSGETGPHPSDNIGGILAATETAGAGGRDLILGTAIAYEICGQIVDGTRLQAPERGRGWDYPIFHAISTSLGAAKVLGLSREQMANALSLAVVANICVNQTRHGRFSNWKAFAGPNGSRNGLFAALVAREGISGPEEPFEGKAGYMKQLDDPFRLGPFGGGGNAFKIEHTFFKCLPVRYTVQLPVWIAIEISRQVKVQDIESIAAFIEGQRVVTPADYPDYWDPATRETADHSTAYLIAAALTDGEISSRTFTPARYRDPAVLALVRKTRLVEDPEYTAVYPRAFHCRLEVTLKSGRVVSVHQTNPKGHVANPMSDRELEEKFLKQADGLLPRDQSRALLDRLWELETVEDVSELFTLMRVME